MAEDTEGIRDSMERVEDARYLFEFKTQPCRDLQCEDQECWNYHSYKDKRRVPRYLPETQGFTYSASTCTMPSCDYPNCTCAHNGLEVSFHPLLYKTKLCAGMIAQNHCNFKGPHCAFAHSQAELRLPACLYDLKGAESFSSKNFRPKIGCPPPGFASAKSFLPCTPPSEFNAFQMDDLRISLPPPPGLEEEKVSFNMESNPEPESVANSDLFKLHREQGALEARLRQVSQLISRRKELVACGLCHKQPRALVSASCGHCLCVGCVEQEVCPVCGCEGGWIALEVHY